tara:strand:- start:1272 stop:2696 length:1425 start_codon:yes stop_codon:yes gene_type:complete
MAFQTVPVNVTGPTYQSRSKPLSSQQTKNWYQQFNEAGKDTYVLMPFPGLKTLGNAEGKDRGFHRMAEILYQVKGTSLYEINKLGVHTLRGSIPSTERCIIADDGINMFIVVPGQKVWQYTTDTNLVTEVTDVNITGALSVDFFNNQFIYTFSDFSTISNVGNGAVASGLNIVGEETLPDAMVRDFVFEEIIYRCGVRSIVGWYNSGVGAPPIDKYQGRIFNVGLSAPHSIAKTDEAFYWLGDDNAIYRAQAGSKQRISTDAISHAISTFDVTDDAIGFTYTLEGQNFYTITFPTANKTFTVSELLAENGWFELSSGTSNGKWQASSVISAYGKDYAADDANGNVYCLCLDTYTNNSEALQRTRIISNIDARLIGGAIGDAITMSSVTISMETGVGLIAGQGDNPRIMVEASYDGGRTWAAGAWPRVGRLGEFVLKVKWDKMKTFYDCMLRLSSTDPVNYSVYSANIDLKLAGK